MFIKKTTFCILLQVLHIISLCAESTLTKRTVQTIINHKGFGSSSIDKELFDYILNILPDGKIMIELGSGWASGEFSKHYTVYSIEDDPIWLNRYDTNYIYASITDRWYNVDAIQQNLPEEYDLILVDGPLGLIGREGFCKNLHLFRTDVPIIFDDVDRCKDYNNMVQVAKKLNRTFSVHRTKNKKFGVIMPN